MPDRTVACGSCAAGRHGHQCWRAGELERRLARRRGFDVRQLLTIKEAVYDLLAKYPDARNSDVALIRHYFEDRHGLIPSTPWTDLLDLITAQYKGWVGETIRRRRAEHQAAGFFPPCEEVDIERRAKESVYKEHFSPETSS